MIKDGTIVKVHYTGKYTNGDVFDTSSGKDPLHFRIGAGQIIPGFEKALIGKNTGDVVLVTIKPDEAYGDYKQELKIKVSNEKLPGPVQVGQTLQAFSDENQPVQVEVIEVNEDHIIVDANHPLAGQELVFDIEVVEAYED